MNALIVDTSSWISYFAGAGHREIDVALSEGRVHLPPIVAAELLSGKMLPKQRKSLSEFLQELPLCPSDILHWIRVGNLRADLLKQGFRISTPDAHIIQCCLDLDCFCLSEDKIFFKISGKTGLRLLPAMA